MRDSQTLADTEGQAGRLTDRQTDSRGREGRRIKKKCPLQI